MKRWYLMTVTAGGQTDYHTGMEKRPTVAAIERKRKSSGNSARAIALFCDTYEGGRIVSRERIPIRPCGCPEDIQCKHHEKQRAKDETNTPGG